MIILDYPSKKVLREQVGQPLRYNVTPVVVYEGRRPAILTRREHTVGWFNGNGG